MTLIAALYRNTPPSARRSGAQSRHVSTIIHVAHRQAAPPPTDPPPERSPSRRHAAAYPQRRLSTP